MMIVLMLQKKSYSTISVQTKILFDIKIVSEVQISLFENVCRFASDTQGPSQETIRALSRHEIRFCETFLKTSEKSKFSFSLKSVFLAKDFEKASQNARKLLLEVVFSDADLQ
jgi:hypothetical protein